MNLSVIIPFRSDESGNRGVNLALVLNWLSKLDAQIILAEHSVVPAELDIDSKVRRIHIPSQGAFNKAQACNQAFALVATEAVAIVDADMIVDTRVLAACAQRVIKTDEVIRPFGYLVELTEAERSEFASSGNLPEYQNFAPSDARDGEVIPACGGAFVMRSDRYLAAGGMDERFVGWGGEDNAFELALRQIDSTLKIFKDQPAFHLYHPRSLQSRYGHASYVANSELLKWWHAASDIQLAEHIASSRAALSRKRDG